mmetsp:Transcript_24867/g.35640  ORF Transcript_24867/g.35640 Transcript_24867/m.35640 type:complete len:84 (+) Transcript_24867:467-718(+)
MATKILKTLEDSRSKATSDYAILKTKQDKHLATLRNVNPSKPRLQDPLDLILKKCITLPALIVSAVTLWLWRMKLLSPPRTKL